MPKVSVYLPDSLYRQVRERGLPLSALAQEAVEQALRKTGVDDWIARVRPLSRQTRNAVDTSALMDAVRDDFGT